MKNSLLKVLGFVIILGSWEIGARVKNSPIFIPFSKVVETFFKMLFENETWIHIGASVQIILIGFSVASLFAITLGILLFYFNPLKVMFMPVIDSVRGIAALSIFPLLIVVLGIGVSSKSFVIFWTSWPSILLSTMAGLSAVEKGLIEAGMSIGASKWQILWRIQLPIAKQEILTGMRIGLSGGWISLVSAEMLGSSKGLGFYILTSSQSFRFAEMYATIMFVAILGLCMNAVLWVVQKNIDKEWRD